MVYKPNFMLSTLCEWILKSTHQSLKQWFNICEPAYKLNVYKTSEVRQTGDLIIVTVLN